MGIRPNTRHTDRIGIRPKIHDIYKRGTHTISHRNKQKHVTPNKWEPGSKPTNSKQLVLDPRPVASKTLGGFDQTHRTHGKSIRNRHIKNGNSTQEPSFRKHGSSTQTRHIGQMGIRPQTRHIDKMEFDLNCSSNMGGGAVEQKLVTSEIWEFDPKLATSKTWDLDSNLVTPKHGDPKFLKSK